MNGNKINYQKLYDRVGGLIGWDFSKLKVKSGGEKWDFYKLVVEKARANSILLDIGTGGGERVLKISSDFLLVIGIDLSKSMINTANNNLQKSQITNIRFLQMDAKKLDFPNGFFDIVSCRHSDFFVAQVARVLVGGGIFLTQQVSEADKLNIKQAFGRGQSFGVKDSVAKETYINHLEEAGFSNIKTLDYDANEWYETPEDLIFLLRNTPIIPDFGKQPEDFEILSRFIDDNKDDKGIFTNSKRYMIIAEKGKG
ncbi:class I SAM-dependent methyltransferase [Patescibacteria group bacterium]|nr:class I SAM-dependent methyltransferase [Patescibacteria group bacterium]